MRQLHWFTLKSNRDHYLSVQAVDIFAAVQIAEELLRVTGWPKYSIKWSVDPL